jgi:hypothetical protein
MPGGVSPSGLDAGAPPVDSVLRGPVLPWGCVTFPLGLVVDWSLELDWEKAAVESDNNNATDKAMILFGMVHLQGHTLSFHCSA